MNNQTHLPITPTGKYISKSSFELSVNSLTGETGIFVPELSSKAITICSD